jgi:uncharacterized ion transporter superfamily protein YfcC
MEDNKAAVRVSKRTFITAIIILGILMIVSGILTYVIPAGSYDRTVSEGREIIRQGTFHFTESPGFPVWRWLTAPAEVLWSADGPTVIVIIFFLLAIASAISLLDKSYVLSSAIARIVRRFMRRKYLLMAVIVFFFMLTGAVLGTFEENIALVPIAIALAYSLKWDSLVGLGMSMLASCFGFTAAITNPFSIAITQRIAELPLYSGSLFRIIVFLAFYGLIMLFLVRYAKRIEKDPEKSMVYGGDNEIRAKYASAEGLETALGDKTPEERAKINRAMRVFGISILAIFALIIAASFISAISDFVLPLIGVLFLTGSVIAAVTAGMRGKQILKVIGKSCAGIAPGILLILMAMSVKFIITHGGIMDTILYYAAGAIAGTSPFVAILLVYVLILLLELFIGSSSAKAFLIMPLIAPLSDLVGITRQTSVLAFCFGDGFSNMFYPTNPVLIICLGLTVVTYPKWVKWSFKLQLSAFVLACIFLGIGILIHLGPF